MRRLLAVLLILALVGLAPVARAEEAPAAPAGDTTLVLGLTPMQLAIAAVVGAAIGAAAAFASGNGIGLAGAGLGTLAAIYVAHLFVEAVLVGGFYYFWPWEDQPQEEPGPSRTMAIRIAPSAPLAAASALQRPTMPPTACGAC
jgi:hypothetical protein